jgi:hypothetical protein
MTTLILKQLEMYPNPVSDELYLSFNSFQMTRTRVFDVSGNLVIKEKYLNSFINTASLSKGIFFEKLMGTKAKSLRS